MTEQTQVGELEGRELDAAVAREVVGWTGLTKDFPHSPWMDGDWGGSRPDARFDGAQRVPRYSEDIAAAWEVVEEVRGWSHLPGTNLTVDLCVTVVYGDHPYCKIHDLSPMGYAGQDWNFPAVSVGGEGFRQPASVPEAICRAALKAVRAA